MDNKSINRCSTSFLNRFLDFKNLCVDISQTGISSLNSRLYIQLNVSTWVFSKQLKRHIQSTHCPPNTSLCSVSLISVIGNIIILITWAKCPGSCETSFLQYLLSNLWEIVSYIHSTLQVSSPVRPPRPVPDFTGLHCCLTAAYHLKAS